MSSEKLEFTDTLNPNTEFLNGRGFWAFYLSILFLARIFISLVAALISDDLANHSLSITNILHSLITLYIMHWIKGATFQSPFWTTNEQGKFDKLTWWEQLDNGQQNTMKKKLLTAIPVILGLLACVESKWEATWMLVNFVFAVIAVLGKLPFMHQTRLLGINE